MFSRYLKNTSFSSTKPTRKFPVACTTFSMTMANTCHLAAMNLFDPLRHSRAHHGESGRTTHQCHDQRRREEPVKLPFVGWLALFDHLCQIEPMSQTPQQQKMFFLYPSSHNHGSVKNEGCISNMMKFLSFGLVFHWTIIVGERVNSKQKMKVFVLYVTCTKNKMRKLQIA